MRLMMTLALVVSAAACGAEIRVPQDFANIQQAIDASSDGDEIRVATGFYNEAIDFDGKAVRLYSESGPIATAIDGNGLNASVVTCTNGEGPETILDGFTLTRGAGTHRTEPVPGRYGGGMYIVGASPTVVNCVFADNTCTLGGGMQLFDGSHPTLIGCRFEDNVVAINGGGIFAMRSCSPTLVNCTFDANRCNHVGGGLAIRQDCHPLVVNSLFVDNFAGDFGGAVRSGNTGSSPRFVGCLFHGNEASDVGGAYAAGSDTPGRVGHSLLVNCIFWANTAPLGPQIALNGNQPADATVTYCNVQDGEAGVHVEDGFTLFWREGNIEADPMFVDAGGGDFHLQSGSPCTDAGATNAVPRDTHDLDGDGVTNERVPIDRDGEHRIMDHGNTKDTGCGPVVVDLGPYELGGKPLDPVTIGDIDGNCAVDIEDLLEILDAWGSCDGCCLADLDFNFDVDLSDLLTLLANWAPCER